MEGVVDTGVLGMGMIMGPVPATWVCAGTYLTPDNSLPKV